MIEIDFSAITHAYSPLCITCPRCGAHPYVPCNNKLTCRTPESKTSVHSAREERWATLYAPRLRVSGFTSLPEPYVSATTGNLRFRSRLSSLTGYDNVDEVNPRYRDIAIYYPQFDDVDEPSAFHWLYMYHKRLL